MASFTDREKIKEIAFKYAELLKKEMYIKRVYLFGSYAKGTDTEDSDIDIIVVGDNFSDDLIEDTFKLMKIRRRVDNRIEPHPFKSSDFNLSNPFVREILNTSIRII
ncbi:MAG: nucleotidyltransferase domain-containing protein [Tissierellales bacterium]